MGKTPFTYRKGFRKAKIITKKEAKTFYMASLFLPPKLRRASYSIYAICRRSDDAVDKKDSQQEKEKLLKVKEEISLAYSGLGLKDEILLAFQKTIQRFNIPIEYFGKLLEGMQMDLEKTRYKNFSELNDYCYKVAGIIGLIMLRLFRVKDKKAHPYAIDLGIAMQLTNIIRDIKEDFSRGRIYLPQEEMSFFGVSDKHIADKILDEKFISFIKFQIDRAKSYFFLSEKGLRFIPGLRQRFVAKLMSKAYFEILNEIEKNNYDIFSRRCYVNTAKKIGIIISTATNQ
ncbi:MAG: phytoene/squalene synthase family protein [Candidatus Omnitrophica bacterium]|nr:phytoene/squalene synthase family protein [Candidatus Omnitrophota bacterium]MDD5429649.1 phytoene/squalene synthase family protein [Candidatus Omnitrophota bacterium]